MRRSALHLVFAVMFLVSGACASELEHAAPALAPLFTDSARVLNIIAHQDDDIFAMTPDLWNTVRANRVVRTVVFTAGDANLPCNEYVVERGVGQMLAYEAMAGVSYGGNWPSELEVVAGKTVLTYRMPDPTRDLSIVYIGLSNKDDVTGSRWAGSKAKP